MPSRNEAQLLLEQQLEDSRKETQKWRHETEHRQRTYEALLEVYVRTIHEVDNARKLVERESRRAYLLERQVLELTAGKEAKDGQASPG